MNESLDIYIEQYLDELLDEFKPKFSSEINDLIRRSIKYTLVCELNMHIHNQLEFNKLSGPSQFIFARWEKYEIETRKGVNHESDPSL